MRDASTVRIGAVDVAAVRHEAALRRFLDARDAGERLSVHFVTAHTLVEADRDPGLAAALGPGELIVPDGVPLVWVGRASGQDIERVCGLDVLPEIADRSRALGLSHYFYGGREGVAEHLARTLSEQYPGLRVAGIECPPFRPLSTDEELAMVERLNASGADFVWVGLGTPKQDLWVHRYRSSLDAACLMAVGAAFDIVSGQLPRAPLRMQQLGLEWLWRLLVEPRRLFRRYTVTNVQFVTLVGRDLVRRGRTRRLRFRKREERLGR